MDHVLELILALSVMSVCGFAGGLINALRLGSDGMWFGWVARLGTGMAASFLIPLFLNTISSTLLSNYLEGQGKHVDLLVFAGFCLLAALSSEAFIRTLSDRVLLKKINDATEEANAAKEQSERAKETSDAAVRVANENKLPAEDKAVLQTLKEPEAEALAAVADTAQALTNEEQAVLKAVFHPSFVLRTMRGVATGAQLGLATVEGALASLESKGLVLKVPAVKGEGYRWMLAPAGKALLTP
jgi:hypothetical protein